MRGNKVLVALCSLVLALALFAGGGCGGSSSRSGNGVSAMDLAAADSSGVPKLFTLPGVGVDDIVIMGAGGKADIKAPAIIVSVVGYPDSDPSTGAKDDGAGPAVDVDRYYARGLKKGVKYTFEVTNNGMAPLDFAPMIKLRRILKEAPQNGPEAPAAPTPQEAASTDKGTQDTGTYTPEHLEPLDFYASNIPAAETAIIAGTFTAPEDGDYLIEVSDAYDTHALPAIDPASTDRYNGDIDGTYEREPHVYIFRFYEERGAKPEMYGSPVEVYGDNGYILTPSDLVELRRAMISPSTKIGVISSDGGEREINEFHWDRLGEPADFADVADAPGMYGESLFADMKDAGILPGNALAADIPAFPVIGDDAAGEAAVRAYSAVLGRIQGASVYGQGASANDASANGTRLDSNIKGIPFRSDLFKNGFGIDAPTGTFAQQQIIDNVDFGDPKITSPVTTSTAQFISTKEDYEKTLSVNTEVSLNTASVSIKNDTSVKNSVKYSNLTTTLWLHFDMTDQLYKEIPLSKLVLTQLAKDDIAKGMSANDFRKKYGDYVVDGFCYTAHYDAFITITTNSVEKLQQVKNTVKVDVKKVVDGSATVDSQTKEALKNTNIQITVNTIGKARTGWAPDFTFIGAGDSDQGLAALFKNMVEFANPALAGTDFDYGIKYVSMRRVSTLPGCSFLPEEIDMEPDLFVKTRQMSRARLELIAQYNAVKDIPDNNLVDGSGRKRGWTEKFQTLYDDTSARLNEICSSVAKVEEHTRKLNALADEFSAISQRWSFYRSLMSEKARENDQFGNTLHGSYDNPKSWSWGYENFPWSSLVNNSAYSYYPTWCYSLDKGAEAFSYWWWRFDCPAMGDSQIAYLYIWSGSNHDDIKRENGGTIGGKELKVYFEGGTWREAHWKLNYRRADISDKNLWPFVGL